MSASIDILREASSKIPYGYCQCGCGQKTKIAPETNRRYGYVKGEPLRYIHGHNSRGATNPNYNMGLSCKLKDGKRRWVVCCKDGTKVYWARVVMENHMGRPLRQKEHVHHINGDPLDDRIENLRLVGHREHASLHTDYTDKDLSNLLRAFAVRLGRIPRQTELACATGMPMPKTYTLRFGSWFKALQAADVLRLDPQYAREVKHRSKKRQVKSS